MRSARIRHGIAVVGAALVLGLGCFPVGTDHKDLDGPYRLLTIDVNEDTRLCYDIGNGACVGRVAPTVFAAGWDERYVIAKRHPGNDRTRVEYFVLDRAKDSPTANPEASVLGPFTKQEFDAARRRLNVDPNLGFSVVVHELE